MQFIFVTLKKKQIFVFFFMPHTLSSFVSLDGAFEGMSNLIDIMRQVEQIVNSSKCIAIVFAITYNNIIEGVIGNGKNNKYLCKA